MFTQIEIQPRLTRGKSIPLLCLLVSGLLSFFGTVACSHDREVSEEARVKLAFESCKQALINHQTDQAMVYIPRTVYDYLDRLKSPVKPAPVPASTITATAYDSPGVTLLLRTALDKKVPADLRPTLTLDTLMRRILDKRLLNSRDVEQINIGSISVDGKRASGEIYYEGTLTALRLPFLKEGDVWKIDIMSVLPYAEVLMRLDRAIKGETQDQQVEQLVNKLPSL